MLRKMSVTKGYLYGCLRHYVLKSSLTAVVNLNSEIN